MTDYLERIRRVLAPSGHFSRETEQRFLAGIQEIMANGCLSCMHNPYCTLPHHGMSANAERPCPAYIMGDDEELIIAMYEHHFPEYKWKEIFTEFDCEFQERAFCSFALEVCAGGGNESR